MLVKERFMKLKAVSLIAGMLALKVAATAAQTYNWTTVAGTASYGAVDGTNSTARFNFPSSVAVGPIGNVYVTDTSNNTIRELAPVGTNWMVSTISGTFGFGGGFFQPKGIVADKSGKVYVAIGDNTIRKLTPSGGQWMVSTVIEVTRYLHEGLAGIALDLEGNLYIADNDDNTIRRATPTATNWVVSTIAGKAGSSGSADGTNSAARFSGPVGIAVKADGNVYVADGDNQTIRTLVQSGTNWVTSTIAGKAGRSGSADGTNSSARF